ncbi:MULTISPECIES: DUF6026 family protein [Pseudomonas]|uniref:DUF6026 family protein n=1 Tax=Pseudomonas TaxID=286 RepID=UPI001BE94E75|nr:MULTISPECIES: DUF6026 family protein [Pseudomonas]MBT2341124.1 hypothetical protein [Pseudomonas fluorescens]MCD4529040.1 DUF6026 family protein [Pseudomonas sp. C3-2018]
MGPVVTARPPQTLYVTIRRDELRLLKEERDLLLDEVTQLRMQLQHAQLSHQSQAVAR